MTLKSLSCWILLFICTAYHCNAQYQTMSAYEEVNQANTYRAYLNYGEAIDKYEKAIQHQLQELPPHNLFVVNNYVSLGKTYLEIGDVHHAKLYCKNAYKNIQPKYPNSIVTANCLVCLAEIEHYEGNNAKALSHFQAAEKLHLVLWSDNNMASFELYLAMSKYYTEEQMPTEAFKYLEKIKLASSSKKSVEVGEYYESMAQWYSYKNQLDEAIKNYQKAITTYQKGEITKYPAIARIHLALGDLYLQQQNNADLALKEYQQVLSIFENLPSLSFLSNYDTYECNPLILDATSKQANVYEKKYNETQKEEYIHTSLFHFQQAIEKITLSVQHFAKEPLHRQQIINQHKSTFVGGVRVAQQLYQIHQDKKYIQQAFDFANAYKALSLQIEKKQEVAYETNIPQSVIQERAEWSKKMADAKAEIYEAEVNNHSNLEEKKQDFIRIKSDYSSFLNQFKNTYYLLADSISAMQLTQFDEIPSLLSEQELLINYVIDQEHQQLYLFSFSNKKSTFQSISIPASFQKDIEKFHRLLQSSLLPRVDKKQQFTEIGYELYKLLIQPLKDDLVTKKRLIIIRDDALHLLPFEALLTSNQSNDLGSLDYLLRDFEITYHYSTGLWAYSLENIWQGKKNSVLGFAPVFDEGSTDSDLRSDTDVWDTFRCFAEEAEKPKLIYSEKEIETINELLGNSPSSTLLLRKKANEKQLKLHLEQPHRFVHIASHSFANYAHPQFSGVACIDEQVGSSEDGMLFINEIEHLDISADLVVLSSCESGMGQLIKGEGLLGINRSFLYAGVPNTIFSLWKVQDQATAHLMINFYKNINLGMDYSKALHQAKLSMLQNPKTASPIFWSSFILMGR